MKLSTKFLILCAFAFAISGVALHAQQLFQVVSVTGYVLDELTREAVNDAKVTFLDEAGKPNSSVSHSGGYYLITGLKPGKKYTIRVQKPNYFQEEYEFQAPNTGKYAEISRDFLVKPMHEGAKLPLAVSPFNLKKSKLRVGMEEVLGDIARTLMINPNVKIEIRSYPDADGDKSGNMKLTEERAKAVQDYLVQNGVAATRISVKSNGDIDPYNPLPIRKQAKGKQYIGKVYIVVTKV